MNMLVGKKINSIKYRYLAVMGLLVYLAFPTLLRAAESCQVTDSSSCEATCTISKLGERWFYDNERFGDLASIKSVTLTNLSNSNWADCSGGYGYSYFLGTDSNNNENVLWTRSACRGDFTVVGSISSNSSYYESCEHDDGTAANAEVSQSPLFLTGSVDANLMFILDDSGSMQFEVMPYSYHYMEGNISSNSENYTTYMFMFPRDNNIYNNSSDYSSYYVPSYEWYGDDVYSALTRSVNNVLYYDPSKTYTPWVDEDGEKMLDANPEAAYHNPYNTSAGSRDLTQDNRQTARWVSCNSNGSCSYSYGRRTFYPATYYYYQGDDVWDHENYTKTEIRASRSTYEDEGREFRVDCVDAENGICTYAEEMQNFANWYSYYRSRVLAARAGVGRAFAMQGTGLRVGFASLNTGSSTLDGERTSTIITGVRAFEGSDREAFFDNLYDLSINPESTPLRGALKDVGEYFSRNDSQGPWADTPGTDDGSDPSEHLECRQSYTLMMTDGYWDTEDDDPREGNTDGRDGSVISNPDGDSYKYEAEPPFSDDYSDTLADVAMAYWKNDLRTDLDNEVPVNTLDPAFWQHMAFYGVGFGVEGTVDSDEAFAAISSGSDIDWPNPFDSDSAKIDDLLHASVNGRGGFFSASDPDTLANELAEMLSIISTQTEGSSTNVTVNSVELDTDTLVYQAQYDSSDWSGHLYAYDTGEGDDLVLALKWDAADLLPDEADRNILTYDSENGTGIDFLWNSLTSDQKALLDDTEDKLIYLRGGADGFYRVRSSRLGDIVNSDPVFVEDEDYGYSSLNADEGDEYDTFVLAKTERPAMLYVGANDGMLHGFDAETGVERFAYVPNAVFEKLTDLLDLEYEHQYYADGDIHVSDAYIDRGTGDEWRTVLVGGLGGGGKGVYALDITDPENMTTESVLWEFTDEDDEDLGYTFGTPRIARLYDGTWAAIFGNGYSSADGKAVLYIVNLETGDLIKKIDTEVGDTSDPNGLSGPVYYYSSSSSGGVITTYAGNAYAGDLQGNLWKFDLSASNANSWDVAFVQGNVKYPLFSARNDSGEEQPITSSPEIKSLDEGGYMILFGTGKYLSSADVTDMSVQTVYGIRDSGARITATDRSTLLEQEIYYESTQNGEAVRVITSHETDWSGDDADEGWYLDLVSPLNGEEGERVVQAPELWFDRLGVATLIATDDPCDPDTESWYLDLDYSTGGALGYTVFDINGDNAFDTDDYVNTGVDLDGDGENDSVAVSGIGGSGVGNVPVKVGDNLVNSDGSSIGYDLGLDDAEGRLSWRERR